MYTIEDFINDLIKKNIISTLQMEDELGIPKGIRNSTTIGLANIILEACRMIKEERDSIKCKPL